MKRLLWWAAAGAGLIILIVGLSSVHGTAGYQVRLLGVFLLVLGLLFAFAFPMLDKYRAGRSG